jgi:hypothetical protein
MWDLARPAARLAFLLLLALPAVAQSNIAVELDEVTDNRVEAGEFRGSLELRVKLTGSNLENAAAARVIVKEAKDDRGNDLTSKDRSVPDFFPREYNSGTLQFTLGTPARQAKTVRLKGNVELYVPTRDPNAIVKVDKALARLDQPLNAKALKAAKIEIRPLSRPAFAKVLEEQKLDETKIAAIRAEGKKQGVSEKEVEMMIGLAQAFEMSPGDTPEGAVILAGKKDSFDRIYRIEILGSDGKPIDVGGRQTSTRGEDSIMTLQPSQTPPENAALQLYVITQKARVSAPFELTVELP